MKAKIENEKLIIELPVNNPLAVSTTGKTKVVASSHGNKQFEMKGIGLVFIGVNAFIYPESS